MSIDTFKRIERKYVINSIQQKEFLNKISPYMEYDKHCTNGNNYWVQNIYFDTENNTLISNSISKPTFKIKFRVRHYIGTDTYFLEAKQKTNSIVSKRRITLSKKELDEFILNGNLPYKQDYLENQISKELQYNIKKYPIYPKVYISYKRVALFCKNDQDLRITFDNHIRGSRSNFTWNQDNPDIDILDNDKYILEIKYSKNYPLWLTNIMNELKIFHLSFSKYGEEYKSLIRGEH